MLTSQANFSTENADKILYKLCKHFALKIPVDFSTEYANIEFPYGECRIQRTNTVLLMICTASNYDFLAKIEWVVNDHLGLMAKTPELQLDWQRTTV